MGINASFRGVEEDVFRDFKAIVAHEGLKSGKALSEALTLFVQRFEQKPRKKMRLMDLKPVNFGKGSEKSSAEIDAVLYGGRI